MPYKPYQRYQPYGGSRDQPYGGPRDLDNWTPSGGGFDKGNPNFGRWPGEKDGWESKGKGSERKGKWPGGYATSW